MENPIVKQFQQFIGKDHLPTPSPVGQWLNGKLLKAEEGLLSFEFVVRKEMTNPMGILHGGISALIMDEVIGATVHTLNRDVFYTSVNLSVDFLKAVPAGEKVIATAHVVRPGKTIVNVECQVLNTQGAVISKGMSNLVRTFQSK